MKKLVMLALGFGLVLSAAVANAATPLPQPSIAVVDLQKVMRGSTAVQGIEKQLEGPRNNFRAELKKDEDRLRAQSEDLKKSQTTLSKEALLDKQKTLRQQITDFQRKSLARKYALDEGYANAMKQIRSALADIVLAMTKEQNVNLVLPKENTVWAAPSLEITDAVLAQLNAKLPSVTVKVPAPKEIPAGKAAK